MEFENEFDLPPASDESAGDEQDIPGDFVTYGDPDPTIAVPETRKIMTSAPLSGGGTLNADLTLGINAVSAATANSVVLRDGGGRARVAAPVAANDIARKAEVDAVDAKVSIVDSKVDSVDVKVDAVDARVDSVNTAMGVLDDEIDAVDTKVDTVDAKVDVVAAQIPALSDAVDSASSVVAASSLAVKTTYDKVVAVETAAVPTVRNINTSGPLTGGGDLSADITLGINASSAATVNSVMQRDASGRARVLAPVAGNDIANKTYVDAVEAQVVAVDGELTVVDTKLSAVDNKLTAVDARLGAVDSRLGAVDAKVDTVEAKIPALSDAVNSSSSVVAASSKAVKTAYDQAVTAETVSVPRTRNVNTTGPLSGGGALNSDLTLGINASSAANANYVIQRDASGRAKVAAPSAGDDIARKAEVDAVDNKLNIVDAKVGAVDAKVGAVDGKVAAVDFKVGVVDGKVSALDFKIGVVDGKIDTVEAKIPALSDAVDSSSSVVAASSKAVKTAYDKAVEAKDTSVPTSRSISTSAPLNGGGSLNANLTLGINASSVITPNYVIQRDANGRAQVTAPAVAADIARKAEVDAAIAQIPALSDAVDSSSSVVAASSKAVNTAYDKAVNSEAVSVPTTRSISTTAPLNGGGVLTANLTLGLNASSTATPDYVIQRDVNGRAQVAAPVAAADIARKADVDALSALTTPLTRVISTTAPLTGGGDLSANRTLAINAATTAAIGAVQLATDAEASAGTVANKAVTPTGVKAAMVAASVPLARTVSTAAPLTGGGALSANLSLGVSAATTAATGVVQLATDAEASAGTVANKAVTPTGIKTAMTAASVPLARTVSTTAPLTGGGALSGNLTLGLNAASAATANYVVQRDASGRAKVAAPAATDDIARKAEVDAAIAKIPALSSAVNSTSAVIAANSAAVKIAYDKAVVAETLGANVRTKCTKAVTLYVRTDGNDSNDGLTATTAKNTLAGARNALLAFDGRGFNPVIDIGAGTFESGEVSFYGYHDAVNQRIVIKGAGKGVTILRNTTGNTIISAYDSAYLSISEMTLEGSLVATQRGTLSLTGNLAIGPVVATNRHLVASRQGMIYFGTTTCDVYGGSYAFMYSATDGSIEVTTAGINFVNNPTFSYAVCECYSGGKILWDQYRTYTGAVTGRRFIVDGNALVYCGSAIPDAFLPGTINGEIRSHGIVGGTILTSSAVNSTSTIIAANSAAVKAAYDKAVSAVSLNAKKSATGYCQLPNGVTLQWGKGYGGTVVFPIAFSSVCCFASVSNGDTDINMNNYSNWLMNHPSTTGFNFVGPRDSQDLWYWFALGY